MVGQPRSTFMRPHGIAQANWGYPSTNNLCVLFAATDAGCVMPELVTNINTNNAAGSVVGPATLITSTFDATTQGRVYVVGSGTTGWGTPINYFTNDPNPSPWSKPSTAITVVARVFYSNVQATGFSWSPGGSYITYAAPFAYGSESPNGPDAKFSCTVSDNSPGITCPLGQWVTYVGRWKASSVIDVAYWDDSGSKIVSASSTAVGTIIDYSGSAGSGGQLSPPGGYVGLFDYMGVWSRYLPDSEIAQLVTTPNLLFGVATNNFFGARGIRGPLTFTQALTSSTSVSDLIIKSPGAKRTASAVNLLPNSLVRTAGPRRLATTAIVANNPIPRSLTHGQTALVPIVATNTKASTHPIGPVSIAAPATLIMHRSQAGSILNASVAAISSIRISFVATLTALATVLVSRAKTVQPVLTALVPTTGLLNFGYRYAYNSSTTIFVSVVRFISIIRSASVSVLTSRAAAVTKALRVTTVLLTTILHQLGKILSTATTAIFATLTKPSQIKKMSVAIGNVATLRRSPAITRTDSVAVSTTTNRLLAVRRNATTAVASSIAAASVRTLTTIVAGLGSLARLPKKIFNTMMVMLSLPPSINPWSIDFSADFGAGAGEFVKTVGRNEILNVAVVPTLTRSAQLTRAIAATFTGFLARTAVLPRLVAVAVSDSLVFGQSFVKTLPATIANIASVRRAASHSLVASTPIIAALTRLPVKVYAILVAVPSTLTRLLPARLTSTALVVASLVRQYARTLSTTIIGNASLVRTLAQRLSGVFNPLASVVPVPTHGRILSVVVTPVSSLAKAFATLRTTTVTVLATLRQPAMKMLVATSASSASFMTNVQRTLPATIAALSSLAHGRSYQIVATASTAIVAKMRISGLALRAAMQVVATLPRQVATSLFATVPVSETMTRIRPIKFVLTAATSVAGTFSRRAAKVVNTTINLNTSVVGVITYFIGRVLTIIKDAIAPSSYVLNEIISQVNPNAGVSTMSYLSILTQSAGFQPVVVGSTPVYTGKLVDSTLTPVGSGLLTTLTLSLLDTISGTYVNAVQDVNILNTGRGTIDANGNLTIAFLAADMVLASCGGVAAINTTAERAIIIKFTFNGGLKAGTHECRFTLTQPM